MASLALRALGMAERGLTKSINKISASPLASASVADGKQIVNAGVDAINAGVESAKNIADKSNLVNMAANGANDVAKKVSGNEHVAAGMELLGEMSAKASTKSRGFVNSVFGGSELIDTVAKQRQYEMALRRASGGAVDKDLAGIAGRAARSYGSGVNPHTGTAVDPLRIPLSAEERLNYRYRRPNGNINTHRVAGDAMTAAGGVAAAGALTYGAVSYFGDD